MNPLEKLARLSAWGPVFFGVGFVAPLLAQTLERFGMEAVAGLPPIAIGLVVGTSAGLVARARGSWI